MTSCTDHTNYKAGKTAAMYWAGRVGDGGTKVEEAAGKCRCRWAPGTAGEKMCGYLSVSEMADGETYRCRSVLGRVGEKMCDYRSVSEMADAGKCRCLWVSGTADDGRFRCLQETGNKVPPACCQGVVGLGGLSAARQAPALQVATRWKSRAALDR